MKIPVEGMSTRAQNALKNAGVVSYEDLKSKTIDDLYKIRNVGRKTVYELKCLFGDFAAPKIIPFKPKQYSERYRIADKLREEGKTLKEIGSVLGVGKSRAGQMVGRIASRKRLDELFGQV